MNVGFEFEFLSKLHDDEILDDLGSKYDITVDPSIKHDEKCMKKAGWFRWEVITPPEPKKKAIKTLKEVQNYLIDSGARTNNSCGFHINISNRDMSEFDPLTLICTVDEYLLGNTFNRVENPYCIPWLVHFDEMWMKIKKSSKIVDKKRCLIDNANKLINCSAYGDWIPEEFSFAKRQYEEVGDKYVSINVSKLEQEYIEFRMIGGLDYHLKMLEPFVHYLSESIKEAAKGKDKVAIREYFSQYK